MRGGDDGPHGTMPGRGGDGVLAQDRIAEWEALLRDHFGEMRAAGRMGPEEHERQERRVREWAEAERRRARGDAWTAEVA